MLYIFQSIHLLMLLFLFLLYFLDFKGEGSIALEDILVYLMDLALNGDSLEIAQAIRQTLEKRKISVKELQRSLIKSDILRTGSVPHTTFEKNYLKLCGGENYVKSDYMTDIERYIDPNKEGKMDINFIVAVSTVCGDVERAENKLKNLFKIMRVKGIDYRQAILDERGKYHTNLSS